MERGSQSVSLHKDSQSRRIITKSMKMVGTPFPARFRVADRRGLGSVASPGFWGLGSPSGFGYLEWSSGSQDINDKGPRAEEFLVPTLDDYELNRLISESSKLAVKIRMAVSRGRAGADAKASRRRDFSLDEANPGR